MYVDVICMTTIAQKEVNITILLSDVHLTRDGTILNLRNIIS